MKTIQFKASLRHLEESRVGQSSFAGRKAVIYLPAELAGICVAISSLLDLPVNFSMTGIIQPNHFHLTQFNHHLPEMELIGA